MHPSLGQYVSLQGDRVCQSALLGWNRQMPERPGHPCFNKRGLIPSTHPVSNDPFTDQKDRNDHQSKEGKEGRQMAANQTLITILHVPRRDAGAHSMFLQMSAQAGSDGRGWVPDKPQPIINRNERSPFEI